MSIETARAARTGKRDGVIITEVPAKVLVRVLVGKRRYECHWFATRPEADAFASSCMHNKYLLTT